MRRNKLLIREQTNITREIEHEDCYEHKHATEQRVKKKLDSGILTPWTTPHTNEKIHWQ